MSKLGSFTFITLNGFYKGQNEDTSWHPHGGEAAKFANSASEVPGFYRLYINSASGYKLLRFCGYRISKYFVRWKAYCA